MAKAIPPRWLQDGQLSAIASNTLGGRSHKGTMMKRTGPTAGADFGDNRVPGKGQNKRFRKSLTTVPELDNQGAVIKAHRDRVRLFPGRKGAASDAPMAYICIG